MATSPNDPKPAVLPASFTALTGQFAWAGNSVAVSAPPAARAATQTASLAQAETRLRAMIGTLPPGIAAAALRDYVKANPEDAAGLRMLAENDIGAQRYPDAVRSLERALALAPAYHEARKIYANLLLAMGRTADALPHVKQLAAAQPQDSAHRMCLAWCLGDTGDFVGAISLYDDLLDDIGEQPKYALHYADMLKYAGHRASAVHVYRTCLDYTPSMGEAWWSLANMKNEKLSEADIAIMQAQLADSGLGARDRFHIHYALGLALEQAGDYAASFSHYAKGAELKRATITYNGGELPALMQRSKSFFTPARFASAAGAGCPDRAPIFIVGLPRAGSTLIEQILACHSQVEGTKELPEISNIVRDIGTVPGNEGAFIYPGCLASMDAQALAALGQRYIDRTRIYRHSDKQFFIDKMPANWAHAGLIAMILPNAKIIDARRHPMGTCFSAFKQLFGHGVHYSYDLTDLGRYYAAYAGRMAHYDGAMPGRIHRVEYENMVADPETEIRRLLAYCGLAFEPACLRFWESERAVATPSAEQVRQPIYREGLHQWRHYAPWLGPLRAALGELAGQGD